MDGWKMSFLLGRPIFRGYVKLQGVSNNSFVILLMEETLHQLRLVVYPIVSRVFIRPRWLFWISSINSTERFGGICLDLVSTSWQSKGCCFKQVIVSKGFFVYTQDLLVIESWTWTQQIHNWTQLLEHCAGNKTPSKTHEFFCIGTKLPIQGGPLIQS